MAQRRGWVLGLPVAVTFAVVVTVAGFGVDAVASSPGAVASAVFFAAIAMVPGAIIGLIAVVADGVMYKVVGKYFVHSRRARVISVSALMVGGVTGIAVGVFALSGETRTDVRMVVGQALFVGAVAAACVLIARRKNP